MRTQIILPNGSAPSSETQAASSALERQHLDKKLKGVLANREETGNFLCLGASPFLFKWRVVRGVV